MNSPRCTFAAALSALLLSSSLALSQVSTRITNLFPLEGYIRAPLTLRFELVQGEQIENVFLVYRPFGENEYRRMEAELLGNNGTVTIPSRDVVPPFIECYFVLALRSGTLETYPLSESRTPFTVPPGRTLQLLVKEVGETDREVVFLSPEPGERLAADEVVISVSLLRADTVVVKRATQILLDGVDVTQRAVLSEDILVLVPSNTGMQLSPGNHRVTVRLFNRSGTIHRSGSLTFAVTGGGQIVSTAPSEFQYGMSVQLESRHEDVSSLGTWYNRGNLRLNGRIQDWRFLASTFVTSDESSDRQPQNRYFIGVESPYIRAGYGDTYPTFPSLVLNGKRVRGLNSSLRLGVFNVDLALGKTNRAIEGSLLRTFPVDSFAVEYARDSTAAYAQINDSTFGKFSYGTYARNLFAIRPSFGSGETWQLGFTWLKSKDDVQSISYGTRPQENVVLGSDFLVRVDDGRIELRGEGAFSAFNSDISKGDFTDADIERLFPNDIETVKEARDKLKAFITVNENLRPLSLKKLATLAYETSLGLNYFNNSLKFTSLYRGSDYTSFGQTFIRKDIKGFNLSDRVALAENQVFATLGYERLQDNTTDTKIATTTFTNFNIAISYYPRIAIPSFTLGYARYASDNGIAVGGSDSLNAIDDATDRLFLQSNYTFEAGAQHSLSANVSTSFRDDNSVRQYDVKNVVIALGFTTRYSFPLQTSLDVAANLNKLPTLAGASLSQNLDYTTITAKARYAILQDALVFSTSVGPTFGDFQRTVLDLGTDWRALPAMMFTLQFTYFNNDNGTNDTIWSLQYRYDL
jgi:hypothetical protein